MDGLFKDYDKVHIEIFNPIEQERLRSRLEVAVGEIKCASGNYTALDYGSGSGNLTNHLIDLGMKVVSADISDDFLNIVKKRFSGSGKSDILKINGYDLSGVKDNSFDLTATYSVLHHIPDYLHIIRELIRVTKPGGVIFLDHERSEDYWKNDPSYAEFLKSARSNTPFDIHSLKKYFRPMSYMYGIRRLIDPRYQPEGDIHVWSDDHIEWPKIESLISADNCEIVLKENYLLYINYPVKIYEAFKNKCNDCCLLAARKK